MANYKAIATSDVATSELAVILVTNGVAPTVTQDISGTDPLITVGSLATNQGGALIRILDQVAGVDAGWDALPGFGAVQQPVYTGTVFQIAVEGPNAIDDMNALDKIVRLVSYFARKGGRVELYVGASGATVSTSTMVAANLKDSFEPAQSWGVLGRV